MRNDFAFFWAVVVLLHGIHVECEAAMVTVGASKDSTIYSNHVDRGTGGGNALITGTNGQNDPRRALIAFDVARSLPADAVVQSVTMTLTLGQLPTEAAETSVIELHRITSDWGEGTTQRQTPPNDSFGGMGQGAPASDGDVTWSARSWGVTPTLWNTLGGDFAPNASTSAAIGQRLDVDYSWPSTAAAVSDVQGWLDNRSENFGWILVNSDEASMSTFRVFYSRQVATEAWHPQLLITYFVPEPAGWAILAAALPLIGRRRRVQLVLRKQKP